MVGLFMAGSMTTNGRKLPLLEPVQAGERLAASTTRLWPLTLDPAKEGSISARGNSSVLHLLHQSTLLCAAISSKRHLIVIMALDLERLNSKLDFQNQDYWLHIQADTNLNKYPGKMNDCDLLRSEI
jgi:hypothetical protein